MQRPPFKTQAVQFFTLWMFIGLCFLNIPETNSQNRYKSGEIEFINGDKIVGFINVNRLDRTQHSVEFRKTLSGETIKYSPLALKGFTTDENRYRSAIVEMNKSPFHLNDLSYRSEPDMQPDTIFMALFVEGPASLYYFKDDNGTEHFIAETQDTLMDLIYHRYYVDVDGIWKMKEEPKYKGMLNSLFHTCAPAREKIDRLLYKKKYMVQIFDLYNSCQTTSSDYVQSFSRIKMRPGVTAGIRNSTLKFITDNSTYKHLEDFDLKADITPVFGIVLNFILPKYQNRWKLMAELTYSSLRYTSHHEIHTSPENYRITDSEIAYDYLRLSPVFRAKLFKSPVSPVLDFGLTGAMAINKTNEERSLIVTQYNERTEKKEVFPNPRKFEGGVFAGIGMSIANFDLVLRHEITTGVTANVNVKSRVGLTSLLASYHF